jgi:DNA (cytosine-5)-methyltransferase 1
MMRPLIIDNFAGGGGASTGLEAAFGRSVDVAINHDEAAVAVHAANHPDTRHYCQSILSIDPLDATEGRPVALVWFSPDCKHHSKAKGGKPRDKNIRDLAWVVPHWLERLKKATPGGRGKPRVIMLENVEEFRQWGPLDAEGKPIAERKGEEFRLWVARIRRQGYKVEWRELRACDYGAPTSRKRLFLVARCDGLPIVWPEPTHGKPGSPEVLAGKRLPWRTAAECIDWSLPCPSIFDRKKPLEEATCRRIAAGVMRYVVNSARPFIVPVTHRGDLRVHSADEPLRTITTAKRGEFAAVVPHVASLANRDKPFTAADEPMHTVVATGCKKALIGTTLVSVDNTSTRASRSFDPQDPLRTVTASGGGHAAVAATLVQTGYGEREGQAPRALDVQQPLGTVVAGGSKHAAVAAFLHKYRQNSVGADAAGPMPTVTANSFVKRSGGAAPLAVTTAHLEQANTGVIGHDMREPVSTIVGKGCTQRLIETTWVEADALPAELMERAVRTAAFLVKYYGSEVGQHQAVDAPIDTIPTKARFAVITVTIDAATFVLVDIGMRMLTPRELANAQGFPAGYILDPVCTYRTDTGNLKTGPLPKSHQIAKIGNSVCPVMAEALARANLPEMCAGVAELHEAVAA